jgi:hypothetical protein
MGTSEDLTDDRAAYFAVGQMVDIFTRKQMTQDRALCGAQELFLMSSVLCHPRGIE